MTGKDGSDPAPGAEEEFSLFHTISQELTKVPEQKQPLHPENITPDMEGMESLNSLPDIALSGAQSSGGKWMEEDGVVRSGSTITASAHIITAVIGAGVLSLPYSMASLGWIGGPICFILFATITLFTAQLLADLYIIDGKRMRTYTMMVETVFGRPGKIAIGIVQQFNLVLTALAYTITAAQSMQLLANSACGAEKVDAGDCFNFLLEDGCDLRCFTDYHVLWREFGEVLVDVNDWCRYEFWIRHHCVGLILGVLRY
jgi:hypothetical protein